MFVDLHIHSNFSDGSDNPADILEKARELGLTHFALTDHDTFSGCATIMTLLQEGDPFFIPGVEFSCDDEFGSYHVLGYCSDIPGDAVLDLVTKGHNIRVQKCEARFRFLEREFGFRFEEEDIRRVKKNRNPGKPHIAALMLEKGVVAQKSEAYYYLNQYKGQEERISPVEAIRAIESEGGISVLAHGIRGEGSDNLSEAEITARVERLRAEGLHGLECYYSEYTEEQQEIMLKLARKYHMLITAGSDYHGSNKKIPLANTNCSNVDDLAEFLEKFEKRA